MELHRGGLIAKKKSSRVSLSYASIAWGPSDDEMERVTATARNVTKRLPQLVTFDVRHDASVPKVAIPAWTIQLANVPAKAVLMANPRLDQDCNTVTPAERSALLSCVQQIPDGVSVERWLIGRDLQAAMDSPECK